MCLVDNSRNARLEKALRQSVQLPQPGRSQHRHSVDLLTITEHIGGVCADRARRAIRQVDHQQQHAIPSLKRPRRQQAPEQRMRLGTVTLVSVGDLQGWAG